MLILNCKRKKCLFFLEGSEFSQHQHNLIYQFSMLSFVTNLTLQIVPTFDVLAMMLNALTLTG